jgi:deoxyribose-phosphate aldolase
MDRKTLANYFDHTVLHPTATTAELKKGAEIAIENKVAAYCLKPHAVSDAEQWLAGSDVKLCTVIGFPHGNSAVEITVAESVLAAKQGAHEVDMVINPSKAIEGDWDYLRRGISSINAATVDNGAILKVIFETGFLTDDQIRKLCEIASEIGVAFVKTSTGFGYVKNESGDMVGTGANVHHIRLMRDACSDDVKIKASGGIRTLADAMDMIEAGADRIGASATAAILGELSEEV